MTAPSPAPAVAAPFPAEPGAGPSLLERLRWRDPLDGAPLTPIVTSRTPAGVPLTGALRRADRPVGYPIVDAVAWATPEGARRHAVWLEPLGLAPPEGDADFQAGETVEHFGFQWHLWSRMRTEADLAWRVAEKFGCVPSDFTGRRVLDAGSGAGDQSAWLMRQGAEIVSVDLSRAIEVTASKLRLAPTWCGVQADITRLPFHAENFDIVYCEGVIQHTRDSGLAVAELARVLRPDGRALAAHYPLPATAAQRASHSAVAWTRRRLSRLRRPNLMLTAGILAALGHIPVLGWPLRRSGVVPRDPRMPDFATSWANTFDMHGGHAFQRYLSAEEFASLWRDAGCVIEKQLSTNVLVRKPAPAATAPA